MTHKRVTLPPVPSYKRSLYGGLAQEWICKEQKERFFVFELSATFSCLFGKLSCLPVDMEQKRATWQQFLISPKLTDNVCSFCLGGKSQCWVHFLWQSFSRYTGLNSHHVQFHILMSVLEPSQCFYAYTKPTLPQYIRRQNTCHCAAVPLYCGFEQWHEVKS
jgi:hypothetical protein